MGRKNSVKFGILLPVTSRGLTNPTECITNVERFAESLRETTKGDRCDLCSIVRGSSGMNHRMKFELKVYVGVDESDAFLNCGTRIQNVLIEHDILDVEVMVFDYPPGSICAIWKDLARRAHDDQCDYTILLGDDIVLKTHGWMKRIESAFEVLESTRGVPHGFGCVAFSDRFFPGFPTFPVMGRIHMEIFDGAVIPDCFINQDGDPYLFQLYRRWGCSVMLPDVFLENTMGGSKQSRYEKKHRGDWTYDTLDSGVNTIRSWINSKKFSNNNAPKEMLTLDVVIPTYRIPVAGIETMIKLKKSETLSTMTIIICDNPLSPAIEVLKKRYEEEAFIRIRENRINMGASESRNRGLAESAADYVLFLDDDVVPDPNILLECEKIIRNYPKACGFVGNSKFPDAIKSQVSSAVVLSGITFFWGVAELMQESEVPWGVTANLLVRRNVSDGVLFDLRFPKTGGGEDIDYCFRKRDAHVKIVAGGEGFRGAPRVLITHPWWNNGGRSFSRFRKWGIGDGALVKMYPQFAYIDLLPNSAEILLVLFILFILLTLIAAALYCFSVWNAAVEYLSVRDPASGYYFPVRDLGSGYCSVCGGGASGCFSVRDSRSGMFSVRYLGLGSFLVPRLAWVASAVPALFLANMVYDVFRHVFLEPDDYLPDLRGSRRVMAAAESGVFSCGGSIGLLEA